MCKHVIVITGVTFISAPALATTLYDGFDYPVGTLAEVTPGSPDLVYSGRTTPFGPTWAALGNSTTDSIAVTSPGLSAPAWLGGTGNSAEWAGPALGANHARIEVGVFRPDPTGSETVYYSLAMQINDVSVLNPSTSGVGNILAGFNSISGPQVGSPGVIGTRLLARQHPSDTSKYQIGMSKNSTSAAQVTWDPVIRDLGTTYFIVGQYTLIGVGSDGNDVSRMWIDPASGTFGAIEGSVPTPTIETNAGADIGIGQIETFLLRQSGPNPSGASNTGIRIDELRVGTRWADVASAQPNAWTGGGANWSNGGSWSMASAPNAVASLATFGASGSPVAVTMDSPHTVGSMQFNSGDGYTIGGGSTLTMSGSSSIVVFDGAHTISAPLSVAGDLTLTTATNKSIMLSNMTMPATARLIKSGYGTATLNNARMKQLTIHGGTLAIAQNGGAGGMSVVEILDIPAPRSQDVVPPPGVTLDFRPRGAMDLKDNALLVRNGDAGTWNGSAYSGIEGLVQLGRGDGSWNGRGLLTSMTDATSGVLTTLAVAKADDLGIVGGTFRGQSVLAGDVLVMYTWGGDADLNGELNGDDYFFIDSNAPANGSVFGFHQGDFDYNGTIDGDDYFIIDSNITFAQASPPFQTGAGAGGVAAVPEPASALVIAGMMALSRRRRRN